MNKSAAQMKLASFNTIDTLGLANHYIEVIHSTFCFPLMLTLAMVKPYSNLCFYLFCLFIFNFNLVYLCYVVAAARCPVLGLVAVPTATPPPSMATPAAATTEQAII